MKKTTSELINEIKNACSLYDFIKYNENECITITIDEYLRKLIDEKNLKVNQIASSANLGDYTYKIFNGSRKGNRDVYIAIAIAIGVDDEQMQTLLRLSKYSPLDPRDARDSVFLYAINKNLSVTETNMILFELGKKILGK